MSDVRAVVFGPAWSIHTQRWLTLLDEAGVTVHLVSWPRHGGWRSLLALPRIIGRARSAAATGHLSVVHTVGTHGLLSLLVPRLPRQVLVPWGSELVAAQSSGWRRFVARRIIKRSDLALTTSASFAEAVARVAPGFDRVETFSWGIHSAFLDQESLASRAEIRAKWGLPSDATVAFSPRGDSETYRFGLIVESFTEAARRRPDLFLVAVGADTAATATLANVRMVGKVGQESMRELYALSDAVISVPATDQRSTAVLEAIASGAHVILSDVPAYREIEADGAQVLILPATTSEHLAAALCRLRGRDPGLARKNLAWSREHESSQRCESQLIGAVLRGVVE